MNWPDSWKHSTVGHVLVSHAVKQVQWWWQAVSQRTTGVRWIIVTQCPQACYSMINNSTATYLFKTKQMGNHIQRSKLCSQWAWVDVVVPVLEDLFIEGGWYRQESKRGGVGDWWELVWGYGDGQLSSIPQGTACYAKQNQSFSKKQEVICQPQQILSVSPPPTTPPTPHLL